MRELLLIGMLMWVATCGQKGPLQLPVEEMPEQEWAANPNAAPGAEPVRA